jgi:hypothetical protein
MSDVRINAYLKRVETYLVSLAKEEREDILAELNSHLRESAALGDETLELAFDGLGSAEDFARGFLDDDTLRHALAGGSPADLWMGVLRQAPRRISAFFGFAMVSIWYLFALSFFSMIVMDLLNPEQTGLWVGDGLEPFFLGQISGSGPSAEMQDIAGPWFIPLALLAGSVSTVVGMLLSRWIAKRLVK